MSVKCSRTRRIKDLLCCLLCSKLCTGNTESAQPIRASHRGTEEDHQKAICQEWEVVIETPSSQDQAQRCQRNVYLFPSSFPPPRENNFTTSDLQNVAKYVPRGASLMAQTVKNLPAMQETQLQSLHGEDLLEMGMTTHSSILAWKIHGERSLVSYSPWGGKDSDTTQTLLIHTGT